ncbi:MAG: hypothetical protein ACRBCL_04305 [Maritimibacter sp.]
MEEVATVSAARMLNKSGQRVVIVHADQSTFASVQDGTDGFFPQIQDYARKQGHMMRLVKARSRPAEMLGDPALGHVHVTMGDMAGYAPDTLHAGHGYIWGFWYLDEVGVHANSSLRFGQFAPERVDKDKAEYFFNGVTGWMLRENVSKVYQTPRLETPLEKGAAVIFCQEIEHLRARTHFLKTEQIIRTVAEQDRNKLVYVKLHPAQSKPMRREIMTVCQDYQNVQISEASVHDLAAASDVVVSQNSAAGFEALMQKKPVVTCAKSDYWHATLTARTESDLREALEFGVEAMADFPFEKYLFWFLHRHLLEAAKEDFAERAWARIADKAFL